MKARNWVLASVAAAALVLAACGGGGSSNDATSGTASGLSATNPGSVSTGSITAFGSVFVNGHEYATAGATVIDDDTGVTTTTAAGLEVGMVVDVKAASSSTSAAPVASELHVHPLVRGYVDATSTSTSNQTLTVMGQTIQTTASTSFSDHRACVKGTSSPCAAITGLSALTATAGSGSGAIAGNYVTVNGYLFGNAATPTTANIVATLVSVGDAPTSTAAGAAFKVEGLVTATGSSSITIGGLSVNLGSAICRAAGAAASCASAFSKGQVVSAFAPTSPTLPAATLNATTALLRPALLVSTAGATVEIEGNVASITSTAPASFTVRGIDVDASSLPSGTSLPAVGDIVKVLGTVGASGTSAKATSVTVLRHALSTTYGFEGDLSAIAAGTAANTFTASVLGQTVTVGATSRLSDESTRTWDAVDPAANPFNITTFQTYLAASTSKHVVVRAFVDASGNLNVISLVIVPASSTDAVAGLVDATPAPVNSATTGTSSTFSIHGVSISADPAAVRQASPASPSPSSPASSAAASPAVTIAAGDEVTAFGAATTAGTGLTVSATPSRTNGVVDFGPPRTPGQDNDSSF